MRRTVVVLSAILLAAGMCWGQSLGDAARQNRQQKGDTGTKKVYTSDDLTAHPENTVVVVPGKPADGSGMLVAPGRWKHNFHVTTLDVTRFPNGGVLHLKITLGTGASDASFDLFPEGASLPADGFPRSLASAHDVLGGRVAKIDYRFSSGAVFQFTAEGSWNAKAGDTNSYSFVAEVDSK